MSGLQTIVNLAEKHGREGVITNAYHECVEEAQLPDVMYVSCNLSHCETDSEADTVNMISTRKLRG